MAEIRYLSDRISVKNSKNQFSLVIAASISRAKESLLLAWLLAWTFCGFFFLYQLFGNLSRENKLAIIVLLSFWAYYEYRIGKMFLWRRFGYESIRIHDGQLHIRNAIKNTGKSKSYFIENIEKLNLLLIDNLWVKTMDQSFWVMGTGRITFEYQGKLVNFGRQLSDQEAKNVLKCLNTELGRQRISKD